MGSRVGELADRPCFLQGGEQDVEETHHPGGVDRPPQHENLPLLPYRIG